MTRDRKRLRCEWNGVAFDLVDTGGIDLATTPSWPATSSARRARRSPRPTWCCWSSTRGPACAPGDAELAATLRGAAVPVVVVANKVDRPGEDYLAAEFHKLGLGEPLPVSATHGLGTGDLLDRIVELLGDRAPAAAERRAPCGSR